MTHTLSWNDVESGNGSADDKWVDLTGVLDRHSILNFYPAPIKPSNAKTLNVNLEKVVKVDTAGLAWLIHLKELTLKSNITLVFHNVPKQLIDIARLSDVLPILSIQD